MQNNTGQSGGKLLTTNLNAHHIYSSSPSKNSTCATAARRECHHSPFKPMTRTLTVWGHPHLLFWFSISYTPATGQKGKSNFDHCSSNDFFCWQQVRWQNGQENYEKKVSNIVGFKSETDKTMNNGHVHATNVTISSSWKEQCHLLYIQYDTISIGTNWRHVPQYRQNISLQD